MDHPPDNLCGNQGYQGFEATDAHYKLRRD